MRDHGRGAREDGDGEAAAAGPGRVGRRAVSRPGARSRRAAHAAVAILVALGALTVPFPFVWMAVTSLKTVPEIQRVPLQLRPDSWSNLANYREVFERQPFGRFLANSALVASISALSSALVSSLAGYGFAKFTFPGKTMFFFAVIGILMVPFQSVVVPLYLWVNRLGLLDSYLGLLAPDLVSVFGVFLMRQTIEVIPSDYIDAARIDGSGELGIFWRVILPMVTPALATLVIIKFMWTWNEFFWPLVVVNSPSMKVVTMGLTSFTNQYFIEYNLVTAAAVISIAPILVVFLALPAVGRPRGGHEWPEGLGFGRFASGAAGANSEPLMSLSVAVRVRRSSPSPACRSLPPSRGPPSCRSPGSRHSRQGALKAQQVDAVEHFGIEVGESKWESRSRKASLCGRMVYRSPLGSRPFGPEMRAERRGFACDAGR